MKKREALFVTAFTASIGVFYFFAGIGLGQIILLTVDLLGN